MYRFHRTPFEEIIQNLLHVLEKHGAYFTFPTVASTAEQKPELLREILGHGCEIASHGFKHIKYTLISTAEQQNDIAKSLRTFQELKVPIKGFRAPYNAYGQTTPEIVQKAGFLWDAGIGYALENRGKSDFFTIAPPSEELGKLVCIPLNGTSDDLLIDELHCSPGEMARRLCRELDKAKESRGLVMFDLHPIRMGQAQYVGVIDRLIEYGKNNGGWFPTVTQAVESKMKGKEWEGHSFCCLLTGDVDNFHFRDYLKRLG